MVNFDPVRDAVNAWWLSMSRPDPKAHREMQSYASKQQRADLIARNLATPDFVEIELTHYRKSGSVLIC
jgi:hypothetical protein